MAIKTIIIEDDNTIREGYQFLLDNEEDIEVVGAYPSVETAQKNLIELDPQVILLDVQLPGLNGLDAIPKIKSILPDVAIIILTVHEDEHTIFKALINGAAGFLTKKESTTKIVASIKEVVQGGGPMSAHIARMVISSFQRNPESPLSKRETEILHFVAKGKSRKQIAQELYIDGETVKSHIRNIYQKLDVHSKEEAIQKARDNKFI